MSCELCYNRRCLLCAGIMIYQQNLNGNAEHYWWKINWLTYFELIKEKKKMLVVWEKSPLIFASGQIV